MQNTNLAENTINPNDGNETKEETRLEAMINKVIAEYCAKRPGLTAEMVRNDAPVFGLVRQAAQKRLEKEDAARQAEEAQRQQLLESVQNDLCAELGLGQAPKRKVNTDVITTAPTTETSNLIPFKGGRGDDTSPVTDNEKAVRPFDTSHPLAFVHKHGYTLTEAAAMRGVLIRGLQSYKATLLNDAVKESPEMTGWTKRKIGMIQSAIDFLVENFGEDIRQARANHAEFRQAEDDLWNFGGADLCCAVFTPPAELWQKECNENANTANTDSMTDDTVAPKGDEQKESFRAAVMEMIGKIVTNTTDVTTLTDKVMKKAYAKGATPAQALCEMATNRQLAHETDGGTGIHQTAHIYAKAANMADDTLVASVVEKRRQIEKPAPTLPADFGTCKKVPQTKKQKDDGKGKGRREKKGDNTRK